MYSYFFTYFKHIFNYTEKHVFVKHQKLK